MEEKSEIRVKFEIGEIKFEAEGSADLVERERSIFNNTLLPAAIDAIVRTRSVARSAQYIETQDSQQPAVLQQLIQLLCQSKLWKIQQQIFQG